VDILRILLTGRARLDVAVASVPAIDQVSDHELAAV
jgi:hypothetical protein